MAGTGIQSFAKFRGMEFSSRGMPQIKYHLADFFFLFLRILLKDKTESMTSSETKYGSGSIFEPAYGNES
jgi:hypothetical protein